VLADAAALLADLGAPARRQPAAAAQAAVAAELAAAAGDRHAHLCRSSSVFQLGAWET